MIQVNIRGHIPSHAHRQLMNILNRLRIINMHFDGTDCYWNLGNQVVFP